MSLSVWRVRSTLNPRFLFLSGIKSGLWLLFSALLVIRVLGWRYPSWSRNESVLISLRKGNSFSNWWISWRILSSYLSIAIIALFIKSCRCLYRFISSNLLSKIFVKSTGSGTFGSCLSINNHSGDDVTSFRCRERITIHRITTFSMLVMYCSTQMPTNRSINSTVLYLLFFSLPLGQWAYLWIICPFKRTIFVIGKLEIQCVPQALSSSENTTRGHTLYSIVHCCNCNNKNSWILNP